MSCRAGHCDQASQLRRSIAFLPWKLAQHLMVLCESVLTGAASGPDPAQLLQVLHPKYMVSSAIATLPSASERPPGAMAVACIVLGASWTLPTNNLKGFSCLVLGHVFNTVHGSWRSIITSSDIISFKYMHVSYLVLWGHIIIRFHWLYPPPPLLSQLKLTLSPFPLHVTCVPSLLEPCPHPWCLLTSLVSVVTPDCLLTCKVWELEPQRENMRCLSLWVCVPHPMHYLPVPDITCKFRDFLCLHSWIIFHSACVANPILHLSAGVHLGSLHFLPAVNSAALNVAEQAPVGVACDLETSVTSPLKPVPKQISNFYKSVAFSP